jgi:hypothetical protein
MRPADATTCCSTADEEHLQEESIQKDQPSGNKMKKTSVTSSLQNITLTDNF